jgi:hypothetical protein
MIKLTRGSKPVVLEENAEMWTEEFTAHVGPLNAMTATIRYRYRDPEIKIAVKRDSHNKCIYCESYVSQVHPGEIEHILPVSKRRDLVVDWDNLAFVCTECNRGKGDYLEPGLPLVNPYVDEPREHLAFFGPTVHHRTGSARGEITVRQLKLHKRSDLWERRKERIEQLQLLLDRIEAETSGPLRDALESALGDELADDKVYAATSREFVRQARTSSVTT